MALLKQETVGEVPFDVDDTIVAEIPEKTADAVVEEVQTTALAPATGTALAAPVNGNVLAELSQQGFDGLVLDWTSFPIISLKTEGRFEDSERRKYGESFKAKILQTKTRWVYRAIPNDDVRKDVAFSEDKVYTSNGILVADVVKNWQGLGKAVQEREYIMALVEMVEPGTDMDGELRILQISPTSKGRLTGAMLKAKMKNPDPRAVTIRVFVGPKIEKAQNPFYPWHFELDKD